MAAVELDAIEQRVIGSLLEKERTVPDTYPMTLNGVRTACNQTSGRDPVMSLGEFEVQAALDRLRAQGLTRVIHPSHGARTPKHRQVLDEVLGLDPAERAVVTLLLLRGAADAGRAALPVRSAPRLRLARPGRTPRSTCCRSRDDPLVEELPASPARRRPGGSTASARSSGRPTRPDEPSRAFPTGAGARREGRRAPTTPCRPRTPTSSSTSSTASRSTAGCSSASPTWPTVARSPTSAADPARSTAHLAMAGADVTGFDLSPGMVDEARRRFPDLPFEVADLTAPAVRWVGGHHGWYSLVHLAPVGAAGRGRRAGRLRSARRLAGPRGARGRRDPPPRRVVRSRGRPRLRVPPAETTCSPRSRPPASEQVEWYVRGPSEPDGGDHDRLYVLARRPTS